MQKLLATAEKTLKIRNEPNENSNVGEAALRNRTILLFSYF